METIFFYSFKQPFYTSLEFFFRQAKNEDIVSVSDGAFKSTDQVIHNALENSRSCLYTEAESSEVIESAVCAYCKEIGKIRVPILLKS